MSRWKQEKEMVLDTARQLVEKGLVIGASGNVSMRLNVEGAGLLAVTPTSLPYDTLSPDDIQVIDFSGKTVEGSLAPSMETNLHIGIYLSRPDVNAVIHTHAVYASAVAATGKDIPPILDDQVIYLGGTVRCAAYALSGSRELADNALRALGDCGAVLLRNHGAVCVGPSLAEAMTACELLEKTASVYLLAVNAGSAAELSEEAVAYDRGLYERLRENGNRGQTG